MIHFTRHPEVPITLFHSDSAGTNQLMQSCLRKIALFLLSLLAGTAWANDHYPDLRESSDPLLQGSLEATVENLGLMTAVRNNTLSVALVDITDTRQPRVASLNGDRMMYAASLPKIAILLGAFVKIEKGEMALDQATRDRLTSMIRVSSNSAATEMLRRVGSQDLASILQSPKFKLYDPLHNGGLWVGKEYAKTRVWKRDPLHNISHGATALQTARFFYLLETNRLVNPELSRTMKDMLSRPAIHHKFVKGLMAEHPDSKIYRKSGSWRQWHADSAIVERDGRKYIIVALAENAEGGKWLTQIAPALDKLIVTDKVAKR